MRSIALACCAILALAAHGAVTDTRDIVVRKDGKPMMAYVESETFGDVLYKSSPLQTQPSKIQRREVLEIRYFEMRDGAWARAQEALTRGSYGEAADLFGNVAGGGREWMQVYGRFYEGVALELAGKHSAAAEAYGVVASKNGSHPLSLESRYRLGFCLARGKKTGDAAKVADDLEKLGKEQTLSAATSRAFAVRAVSAAIAGDMGAFNNLNARVVLNKDAEPDTWWHYNMFIAETQRAQNKPKDAQTQLQKMVRQIGNDPARLAQLGLMMGLCMVDAGDTQSALIELLKLDVLPYGSMDQKCEARYRAARILWDEVQTARKDAELAKDERRSAFVASNERSARLLAKAAANAVSSLPARDAAKQLLDLMGPDPDAPAPVDAPKKDPAAPTSDAGAPAGAGVAVSAGPAPAPAPAAPKKTR